MINVSIIIAGVDRYIKRWWWVCTVMVICLVIYEQQLRSLKDQKSMFIQQLKELEQRKKNLLAKQNELELQINSQNDPSWIEIVLKKELGLIPEGEIKVYFPDE